MFTVAVAIDCPPKHDGKTLFLMTLHISLPEHGEIKLVLTRKLPLGWLDF